MVWNKIISNVNYLINVNSTHPFLFKPNNYSIETIIIKSKDKLIDLNKKNHILSF